jgi:hypothetical protein
MYFAPGKIPQATSSRIGGLLKVFMANGIVQDGILFCPVF